MLRTPQEEFWAGEFGSSYIDRNRDEALLASKTAMFSQIIRRTSNVRSVRELGANIGLNIVALKGLLPNASFEGVEINPDAYKQLSQIPGINAVCGSLYEPFPGDPVDLAFTCGVLIHLNPEMLPLAYDRLYEASRRYVLVSEYYNPSPTQIPYRGHSDRLFKRDFAGEMMERHPDLKIVDYGFVYKRDPIFPGDDLTWFLMEKN